MRYTKVFTVAGARMLMVSALFSAGASASAQEFQLRFGLTFPMSHPISQGAELFEQQIEERSDGRISVTLYPSGQLGTQDVLQEAVTTGLLDIAQTSASSFEKLYRPAGILALPFGYRSDDHFRGVIKSELGQALLEEMEQETRVKVLTTIFQPPNQITSNRPIRSAEDIEGLRIRVPPVQVWLAFWEHVGASPTPIDFSELYTSLQTGIVDAQENPVVNTYNGKLHEVQSYLVMTNHLRTINMFMMSEAAYSRLPEDLQALVEEVGAEAETFVNDLWAEQNDDAFKAIEAELEVIEIDVSPIQSKAEAFYESYLPSDIYERYADFEAWAE